MFQFSTYIKLNTKNKIVTSFLIIIFSLLQVSCTSCLFVISKISTQMRDIFACKQVSKDHFSKVMATLFQWDNYIKCKMIYGLESWTFFCVFFVYIVRFRVKRITFSCILIKGMYVTGSNTCITDVFACYCFFICKINFLWIGYKSETYENYIINFF